MFFPLFARAITCDVGYYLDSGGNCALCNAGDKYYCPGDGLRYECPVPLDDYSALAYQTFGESEILDNRNVFTWNSGGKIYSISNCYHDLYLKTNIGEILLECNAKNENYWCSPSGYYWYKASPGYYLSGYKWTSAEAWYKTVKPCENTPPENAHFTDITEPDNPICTWTCDSGYGRHGDECVPLCAVGITKLNTSNGLSYNIYASKYTTPAINILYNNTVCYMNLESGNATDAINIQYGDMVYHVTD